MEELQFVFFISFGMFIFMLIVDVFLIDTEVKKHDFGRRGRRMGREMGRR